MRRLLAISVFFAGVAWCQCPAIPNTTYTALKTALDARTCGLSGVGTPTASWCTTALIGKVTYANTSNGDTYACTANLTWTLKGAVGPTGPTGPVGPTGPAGSGGGGGGGGTITTCTLAGDTTKTCTHNLNTLYPGIWCYDTTGTPLLVGSSSPSSATAVISVQSTSVNASLITNNGPTTATCVITTGGVGTGSNIKTCVVAVGDPGAASPALANDNDSPAACGNTWGGDWTITSVAVYADGGTPTTDVAFFGGSSILTGAITGSAGAWVAGTLSGTPVVHAFSANGATCASTPCALNLNITSAGGVAKYLVFRVTGTM